MTQTAQRRDVFFAIAAGEDGGMDGRVQCLEAAGQLLGLRRLFGAHDREPERPERLGRIAAAGQLPAQLDESIRELL